MKKPKLYTIWFKGPLHKLWDCFAESEAYPAAKERMQKYRDRWPSYKWRIKPEGLLP